MDVLESSLDPLDTLDEGEENQSVRLVLEDAEFIEEDAEDGIEEHYQVTGRNDEIQAYRVISVNEINQSNQVEIPMTETVNNTVQVLTSPVSGQLYVISNGNNIFTQNGRSITPRMTTLQIESSGNPPTTTVKKRDERRRVTHNEVERRRRNKINNWITKLGKLLPECDSSQSVDGDGKPNLELLSKGGILARACEYINELRDANENLGSSMEENKELLEEVTNLRQLMAQLKKENVDLKSKVNLKEEDTLG